MRRETGRLAGARTLDQRLKRPLLYQLSYQPVCGSLCRTEGPAKTANLIQKSQPRKQFSANPPALSRKSQSEEKLAHEIRGHRTQSADYIDFAMLMAVTKIQDYSERLKTAMDDDRRPDLGLREQVETVFEEAKELRRLLDEVRHLRRSAPD